MPEEDSASDSETKAKGAKRRRPIREARLPENLPVFIEEIIPEQVKQNPELWRRAGVEESTTRARPRPGFEEEVRSQ